MNPNNPPNPAPPTPAPSGTPIPPAAPVQGVTQEQFDALKNTVAETQSFVQDASYLLGQIYGDPELRSGLQRKIGQSGNPPANPPANPPQPKYDQFTGQPLLNPQTPPPANPQVDNMEMKMREDIVSRVEQKYGYGSLNSEQRKTLRRSVEKRLNQWGGSVLSSPVNQLNGLLEDAYVLEDLPKAKEEGRIEGLVEARQNDMGAFPSMGNQQPSTETAQLSSKQQELTQKWGLNADKVTDRLKEFQETGLMTYKPPTPAGQASPPAPSGTPTPPKTP